MSLNDLSCFQLHGTWNCDWNYFWLNATLCVFSGARNFWLGKVRWSNPQALSSPALLRGGEVGSSAGTVVPSAGNDDVLLSAHPAFPGREHRAGSCLLQGVMNWGCWGQGGPQGVEPRCQHGEQMEKCSDIIHGPGWVSSFWESTEGLTRYAIQFWTDCYVIFISVLHPKG